MTLPDPKRLTTTALLFELIDNRDVVRAPRRSEQEADVYRAATLTVLIPFDRIVKRYAAVEREFNLRTQPPSDE